MKELLLTQRFGPERRRKYHERLEAQGASERPVPSPVERKLAEGISTPGLNREGAGREEDHNKS